MQPQVCESLRKWRTCFRPCHCETSLQTGRGNPFLFVSGMFCWKLIRIKESWRNGLPRRFAPRNDRRLNYGSRNCRKAVGRAYSAGEPAAKISGSVRHRIYQPRISHWTWVKM